MRVSQLCQESVKLCLLIQRTLYARKYLTNVSSMISIMEERDVLARLQCREEFDERSRSLRELKHVQSLIPNIAPTTDKIADVRFGKFVPA